MNDAVSRMLSKYNCKSLEDYENAIKEIIQEVSLLGLWRAKFYEKAAFYGGTALRIFYGLDRFSEDLDFSLLKQDKNFDIKNYCRAVSDELKGLGFVVDIEKKEKCSESNVQSAFIKAGTLENLIVIKTPEQLIKRIPSNRAIKVKLEIDVDPPDGFATDAKYLLQPIPFSVLVYKLPDLFAGKLHAVLCREWKTRVKGRDWYDLVWYVGRQVPVNIAHLAQRMKQTGHLEQDAVLNKDMVLNMLKDKISSVDFDAAKKDVMPMLKDVSSVDVWSSAFFMDVASKIKFE